MEDSSREFYDKLAQDDCPEEPYSEEVILGDGLEVLSAVGDSEEEENDDVEGYQNGAMDQDHGNGDNTEMEEADDRKYKRKRSADKSPPERTSTKPADFEYDLNWEIGDDPEIFCAPRAEHFDDNEANRTLLVQNLPVTTSKIDLMMFFSEYGPIAAIKQRTFQGKMYKGFDRVKNDPCISAYITFKETTNVFSTMRALGPRTTFKDHVILLTKVKTKRVLLFKSVIVTNLAPGTTKEDLEYHFRGCGQIMSLRLKGGIGYITWRMFRCKQAALDLNRSELNRNKIYVTDMSPKDLVVRRPVPSKPISTLRPRTRDKLPSPGSSPRAKKVYDGDPVPRRLKPKEADPVNTKERTNKYASSDRSKFSWTNPNLKKSTPITN